MKGVVMSLETFDKTYNIPGGLIHLKTASEYPAVLSYYSMNDDPTEFDASKLPAIGDELNTVVFNFVDGKLHLTAQPGELADTRIEQWRRYYEFIDTISIGDEVTGIVKRMEPFGLFVDIGSEFIGLIDVGHARMVSTSCLPYEQSDWPLVGTRIQCKIEYLRLHNQQIGLGWLPEIG
jgi:hypothetical protein